MTKKYKVYFSGSSKDGSKSETYQEIVRAIKDAGGMVIYNWLDDKVKLTPKQVFKQGLGGIQKADLLVAEISLPSTGVGQQIALALDKKMPVIALVQKGVKTSSRFTLGTNSSLLHIVEYKKNDLGKVLGDKFNEVLSHKFIKFNFISTRKIDQYILKESKKLHISKSEFLRKIISEKMAGKSARK